MNVYDFDKTIYDGDSSVDFTLYAFKKHPKVASVVPKQISALARYKRNKITKTHMKEVMFSYLELLSDSENLIEDFWRHHSRKIKNFYLKQKQENDVIISASPKFLLAPICKELGVNKLIASEVDINTGQFLGENCYGEEKVKRFKNIFSNDKIDEFYSDSYSDSPLAEISKHAFIVKGSKIEKW